MRPNARMKKLTGLQMLSAYGLNDNVVSVMTPRLLVVPETGILTSYKVTPSTEVSAVAGNSAECNGFSILWV